MQTSIIWFSPISLKWFSSYICNRFQFVKINNVSSHYINVSSGVPQGSHLGPLLFIIFINDLPEVIKNSQALLFADDLKVFRVIDSQNDCILLQHDIDAIATWCLNNNLQLNIKKCVSFSFYRSQSYIEFNYSINSVALDRVMSVKDLGILFDRKLSFNDHINMIVSKANSMLGFIKRNSSEFTNPQTLKCLYMSLVRPHIEYCSIIWNPYFGSNNIRIERVQKNFTRYAFYKLNWRIERPSYSTRCSLFALSTLENRRTISSIIFIRDLIQNHIQCPELLRLLNFYTPRRPLRENFHFSNSVTRTTYAKGETIRHCTFLLNSYINQIDIFINTNRNMFKTQIVMIVNQIN